MPQHSTSILPQTTEPSYLQLTPIPAIVSYLQTVHHHTILPPPCHAPTRENLSPAPRHHDILPPHCHTPHHRLTSTLPRDTAPPSTSTLLHTTLTSFLRPATLHSTLLLYLDSVTHYHTLRLLPCHTPPHLPTSYPLTTALPYNTTLSYLNPCQTLQHPLSCLDRATHTATPTYLDPAKHNHNRLPRPCHTTKPTYLDDATQV
jgi:hypothetical protein